MPEAFLEGECQRASRFHLRFLQAMPRLTVDSLSARALGSGIYEIKAAVRNLGYLPANLTELARSLELNDGVKLCIEGGELLGGNAEEKLGDLEGYSATGFPSTETRPRSPEQRRAGASAGLSGQSPETVLQ